MLGAIIGDIIGSVYEWNNIKTTEFPLFSRGGRPTDDSVMTIAVADGLMRAWGQDDEAVMESVVKSMQYYGRMYPRAGYGGSFRRWIASENPKPYGSWGNGSAMRVSSVAWLYDNLADVMHMAELTAAVTHDHEEGIKGAVAEAAAIFLARAKCEKTDIKAFIEKTFEYDLDTSLEEIRPTYKFDVSCQGSVPQAIRAFLEGNSYEEVVRLAVSIGGDSDTIACMAGAIAEGYYGIPREIRDKGLKHMDEYLVGKVKKFRSFYHENVQKLDEFWGGRLKTIINGPGTGGAEKLQEVIEKNHEYEAFNGEELTKALLEAMLTETEIVIPVEIPVGVFGDVDFETLQAGDTLTAEEEVHVKILHIQEPDGKYWHAVFTSHEELEKGECVSSMNQLLSVMMQVASEEPDSLGLVINPWGKNLTLPKELLTGLLGMMRDFGGEPEEEIQE